MSRQDQSIAVLGAGAFGTALAIALAREGRPVTLWARDPEHAAEMARTRTNAARLPGPELPASLTSTADLEAVTAKTLLIAVPMQTLAGFTAAGANRFDGRTLVACCKGIDLASHLGPVGVLERAAPGAVPAMLSGPGFARDIARGLPTALTVAAHDAACSAELQAGLSTPALRIYRSDDVTGVELGGALKNVVAIACGLAMGAGLGESARAALITRGYAEMARCAVALGGRAETLAGLAGFGDLVLTCTSETSRNYAHGLALGAGRAPAAATVEGLATARAIVPLAAARGIEMPIATTVEAVLDGRITLAQAAEALLTRPLTQE